MDSTSPHDLLKAPLHKFGPEDWAPWYASVASLLLDDQADIRTAAVERLATAALWAEHAELPVGRDGARQRRFAWVVGEVENAARRHADVLLRLLDELRYQGDDPAVSGLILTWLGELAARQDPNLPLDRIEGAVLLIGGIAPWEGSLLPPILDHPSNYVRACAACALGRTEFGVDETTGIIDSAFLAALTARELERPGIAGPYWSGTGLHHSFPDDAGFDVLEWMLTLIEQRSGDEPPDMPFNGIDFYIHELASGHPRAVQRLLATGRVDLALMTATEIRAKVDAMAPILSELARHTEPAIAIPAQIHLAHYHGELHHAAHRDHVRELPNWCDNARAIVVRYGRPGQYLEQLVLFPSTAATFDADEAERLIDAAVSPTLRGSLVRHYLASIDEAPAPYILGADELRSYAASVSIALIGAPGKPGWQRIDISAGRLGAQWSPWHW